MFKTFQARIAVFFTALFIAVQVIAFISVRNAILANINGQSRDQLARAARFFETRIDETSATLAGWSTVLASDFGFRQAVATDDRATIVSAVNNLGARMNADRVLLISLDQRVLADTGLATDGAISGNIVAPGTPDDSFPFGDLIESADIDRQAVSFVVMDGRMYQLVIVPILAPVPIAWIAIGAEIDARFVRRLAGDAVSPLQISFAHDNGDGSWEVIATTLPPRQKSALEALLPGIDRNRSPDPRILSVVNEDFATLLSPLPAAAKSGAVAAILQYSLDAALKPFAGMFQLLLVLAGGFLVLTVGGALVISRSVARPIRDLDEAARRIQQGEYSTKVPVTQSDEIGRLSETFNQMMDGIAERELKIEYQSLHDPVTGLPNRVAFERFLTTSIQWAEQGHRALSVFLVQIGRFSEINNTFGHDVGDELIRELGKIFRKIVKQGDLVARHQSNMFALLLPGAGHEHTNPIVQRVLDAIEEPLAVAGNAIDVTAWIGEAVFPEHGMTAKTLLQRADTAIYEAKQSARHYALYDADLDPYKPERLSIMGELRHGIDRGQLKMFYQPKIDIATGKICAAESLVRWIHPTRGMTYPDHFIPLAEQTGNIHKVSRWAIDTVVRQLSAWKNDGLDIKIAVNLSARDLNNRKLPELIADCLAAHAVPASALVLEITESAIMEDPAQTVGVLSALEGMHLTLAIDDYGIGYSSMSYLRRLPVRELKIDKSFVLNLSGSPGDEIIVRSTIELGHNLGLKVTAEGIEDQNSLDRLREFGCDFGQGYLIAKPMAGPDFEAFWRTSVWGPNTPSGDPPQQRRPA
ncbi:MAG: EAL domain-containing protein [Rhodobacteraceae bacterium]|nr:EAL domain-containing protein [Paracoccaceae bacterium]